MTKPVGNIGQNIGHLEFHIVICAYPQPLTSLFTFETAPMDPERAMSRRNVVEDIASGQIEHIRKIYHASTDQPLRDVSEDIAKDVIALLIDEHADRPKGSLLDFLEEQLGAFAWERYTENELVDA